MIQAIRHLRGAWPDEAEMLAGAFSVAAFFAVASAIGLVMASYPARGS